MKIYDITRTLQDAPVYPGDMPVVLQPVSSMAEGNSCNLTLITAGSHLGTHADAPCHVLPDGDGIDRMPLENFCGDCRVLTVTAEELIRIDDLKGRLGGRRASSCARRKALALRAGAADYLVQCGVKLCDRRALRRSRGQRARRPRILLGGGVAIVENADLSGVPDDDYLIFAFPVKLGGGDGAPVRAVLLHAESAVPPPPPRSTSRSRSRRDVRAPRRNRTERNAAGDGLPTRGRDRGRGNGSLIARLPNLSHSSAAALDKSAAADYNKKG
jgi:arylformamidase